VCDPCPVDIKLSGDGGATWETLGDFTSETMTPEDPANANYPITVVKLESTDPDRWTADSLLRIEFTGTEGADTPNWSDPNAAPFSGASDYEQIARPTFLTVCAEFDWSFKA
jgi:hypothetical protein